MSENGFLKRRWKLLLNIVTLLLLALLVYGTRQQLGETLHNFARINAWALLLIVPIEAIDYHAQTRLYQRLFAIVGNKLSYGFLMKASLELNFVNHVFPSGGAAGLSYFGARLKTDKITASKATLVQVLKLVLTIFSFEAILIIGVIALAIGGHVNNLVMLVSGSLATLLLVSTLLFFYVIGSKARINALFLTATRWINRAIHQVRPQHPETISIQKAHEAFDDLHGNYQQIRANFAQLKLPFLDALLMNIMEVLAVYVVFLAFGHWVNFGAVVLGYAIANFAGLISVLPGGVGVYEGLMTAVLITTGIPAGLSLPVIVMYRIVNTLLQIPPGFVLYQKNLNAPRFSGE